MTTDVVASGGTYTFAVGPGEYREAVFAGGATVVFNAPVVMSSFGEIIVTI